MGASTVDVAALVAAHIRDIQDFPQPGVVFKDITPLLADGPAFAQVIDALAEPHTGPRRDGFDVVAGVEARGFLLAAAVGYANGVGVVPVRKAGKLPWRTISAEYELEYGRATVEVHEDAFRPGQRVLVVDDVLATGGTLAATLDLVRRAGGTVAGVSVLLELTFLDGRDRLQNQPVSALLTL